MTNFHWVWYLLGFYIFPRITIMVALSVYGEGLHIPLLLMVIGWTISLMTDIKFSFTKN